MNAKQFIAATAVFVAAGSAFAADAPAAATATVAAANAVVIASADNVIASNLNVPSISITKSAGRARTDVHGEAVEFVKSHKTAFAVQIDQYKN